MKIYDFEKKHIKEAKLIALSNYKEECECVPILPFIDIVPDLEEFVDNRLGVVAYEAEKMVGFLCCYNPWQNAFDSRAIGTFSPIHAHGAVKENRNLIYKRMYQAAAEKWVDHKITYHAVALYAHDVEAINAMFTYGFGLRCVDAIRSMEILKFGSCDEIICEEISKADVVQIRELRKMYSDHMGKSPCFMYSTPEKFENWLAEAEMEDTRVFIARKSEKPIAYLEVSSSGENFATEATEMCNICGIFCLPEYRGQNIYQNLLNFTILKLQQEGYKILGVEFEGFNPTGQAFWTKYFMPYTNSVVRRIDECALNLVNNK